MAGTVARPAHKKRPASATKIQCRSAYSLYRCNHHGHLYVTYRIGHLQTSSIKLALLITRRICMGKSRAFHSYDFILPVLFVHVLQVIFAGWNNFRGMIAGFEVKKSSDVITTEEKVTVQPKTSESSMEEQVWTDKKIRSKTLWSIVIFIALPHCCDCMLELAHQQSERTGHTQGVQYSMK